MSMAITVSLAGCGNDVIVDVVSNDVSAADKLEEGDTSAENVSGEDAQNDGTGDDSSSVSDVNPAGMKTIAAQDLKIGVLYIGGASDTSGYTYAHELGIQGMISNIGLDDSQVMRMEYIDDGDEAAITEALDECVEAGCNVIFTTSWGYMDKTAEYAEKYPDIYFSH